MPPIPLTSPLTPSKPGRSKGRLRSQTFSLSSPPSSSARSALGSSPSGHRAHVRGRSTALPPVESTLTPSHHSILKTKSTSPTSSRSTTVRPSIGIPLVTEPRQLGAPRGAPPLPYPLQSAICISGVVTPPVVSAGVLAFPFPEQSKIYTNGPVSPASQRNHRAAQSRRRSNSSDSFRSALAVEFDNAVRKRDEESACSSFTLQNRQLWADALFLKLCNRRFPIEAMPRESMSTSTDTAAAHSRTISEAQADCSSSIAIPVSAIAAARSAKELHRKREASSSLGRFKKPSAGSHRGSKTSSTIGSVGSPEYEQCPSNTGSPTSGRSHRRRPSMPALSSTTRHESFKASKPVPKLPDWATNEVSIKSNQKPTHDTVCESRTSSTCEKKNSATPSTDWILPQVNAKPDLILASPISSTTLESLMLSRKLLGEQPPSVSIKSKMSPLNTAFQTPCESEDVSPIDDNRGFESRTGSIAGKLEKRTSFTLGDGSSRRQRSRTLGGTSYRPEEVAKKGLSGRSGILPTLLPILFSPSQRPCSLAPLSIQPPRTDTSVCREGRGESDEDISNSNSNSIVPSPVSTHSIDWLPRIGRKDREVSWGASQLMLDTIEEPKSSSPLFSPPETTMTTSPFPPEKSLQERERADAMEVEKGEPLASPIDRSEDKPFLSASSSLSSCNRSSLFSTTATAPVSPERNTSPAKRSIDSCDGDGPEDTPEEVKNKDAGQSKAGSEVVHKIARRIASSPRREMCSSANTTITNNVTPRRWNASSTTLASSVKSSPQNVPALSRSPAKRLHQPDKGSDRASTKGTQ